MQNRENPQTKNTFQKESKFTNESLKKIIETLTTPEFCPYSWESITLAIKDSAKVAERGKKGYLYVHKDVQPEKEVFNITVHLCKWPNCQQGMCEMKNSLVSKKISKKSEDYQKYSDQGTGDHEKLVTCCPHDPGHLRFDLADRQNMCVQFSNVKYSQMSTANLSSKQKYVNSTPLKYPEGTQNDTVPPVDNMLENDTKKRLFTSSKGERTNRQNNLCALNVNHFGRKKTLNIELHPLMEDFVARTIDKINYYEERNKQIGKRKDLMHNKALDKSLTKSLQDKDETPDYQKQRSGRYEFPTFRTAESDPRYNSKNNFQPSSYDKEESGLRPSSDLNKNEEKKRNNTNKESDISSDDSSLIIMYGDKRKLKGGNNILENMARYLREKQERQEGKKQKPPCNCWYDNTKKRKEHSDQSNAKNSKHEFIPGSRENKKRRADNDIKQQKRSRVNHPNSSAVPDADSAYDHLTNIMRLDTIYSQKRVFYNEDITNLPKDLTVNLDSCKYYVTLNHTSIPKNIEKEIFPLSWYLKKSLHHSINSSKICNNFYDGQDATFLNFTSNVTSKRGSGSQINLNKYSGLHIADKAYFINTNGKERNLYFTMASGGHPPYSQLEVPAHSNNNFKKSDFNKTMWTDKRQYNKRGVGTSQFNVKENINLIFKEDKEGFCVFSKNMRKSDCGAYEKKGSLQYTHAPSNIDARKNSLHILNKSPFGINQNFSRKDPRDISLCDGCNLSEKHSGLRHNSLKPSFHNDISEDYYQFMLNRFEPHKATKQMSPANISQQPFTRGQKYFLPPSKNKSIIMGKNVFHSQREYPTIGFKFPQ